MKVLITGTHFTPAVAVIEQLKNYHINIVYVGRQTTLEGDNSPSLESQVLPNLGVRFIPIVTGRLQRKFSRYTIPSLLKIPIGLLQSFWIILSQRPDVILSFGGYVSVPIVISGWLFSVPIIVHEQTLVSGLANRICATFADKIAVSFQETQRFFNREKTVLTGNPIRRAIAELSTKGVKLTHPNGVQILIMGGSQGSHVINLAVEGCLDKLTKIAKVIHLTGDNKSRDFERLEKLQNDNYKVYRWLGKEYGTIISQVDLVISRAGINTLMELAYLDKPAIVIPIPYLYQDEQVKNANYFEKLGLVKILPQSKLSGKSLFSNIKNIIINLNYFKKRIGKIRQIVIPDAAKRLALETILLAKKHYA